MGDRLRYVAFGYWRGCIYGTVNVRYCFVIQGLKMILDWFDTREIIEFADQIFLEIKKVFPVDNKNEKAAKVGKEKHKLDRIFMKTQVFAQQHRLNIYKKARFLNVLKWRLREDGYPEVFTKDLMALLTTAMSL